MPTGTRQHSLATSPAVDYRGISTPPFLFIITWPYESPITLEAHPDKSNPIAGHPLPPTIRSQILHLPFHAQPRPYTHYLARICILATRPVEWSRSNPRFPLCPRRVLCVSWCPAVVLVSRTRFDTTDSTFLTHANPSEHPPTCELHTSDGWWKLLLPPSLNRDPNTAPSRRCRVGQGFVMPLRPRR